MRRAKQWSLGLVICVAMLTMSVSVWVGTAFSENSKPSASSTDAGLEALIELLKKKGVITQEEANTFSERLKKKPEEDIVQPEPQKEEPTDTEKIKKDLENTKEKLDRSVDQLLQRDRLTERKLEELDSKVKDDIAAKQYKSSWAQRINLTGDIRMRYQSEMFADTNFDQFYDPIDYDQLINTTEDRNRYRYRARLDLNAKIIDPRDVNVGKVQVGLRLATGNEDDPISTNDTMGDFFNKDGLVFDRAYLKYSYSPLEEMGGKIPEISLIGGRMPNPFFSTDLVWDKDLNFEGLALNLKTDTLDSNSWHAFLTVGMFPLDEFEFNSNDKWLYGYQLGFEHRPFWGLKYKLGASYYSYENVQGERISNASDMNTPDWNWSVPKYAQKGNSPFLINNVVGVSTSDYVQGIASDFEELNFTLEVDLDRFYPVHVILFGDYVKNLGYDKEEVFALQRLSYSGVTSLSDVSENTQGYQVGTLIGYPKVRNPGEWNFSFAYKYLEGDAVLAAFTDSDFHGGGTDAKGWIIKTNIGLYKNVWLTGSYMTADEVYVDESNPDNTKMAIDVLQVDINAAF